MVYHVQSNAAFLKFIQANFYTAKSLKNLIRALIAVDYSVVDSRREGHKAVIAFLDSATEGDEIVSTRERFPPHSLFVCDADPKLADTLISLANALSFRSSNVAKDSSVGNAKDKSSSVELASDQGTQDNAKRFEELTKVLQSLVRSPDHLYNRVTFEERAILTWTDDGSSGVGKSSGRGAAPAAGPSGQ